MTLIDTHVHINFPDYRADLDQAAERWRAAGVVQMVHSCVMPAEFGELQAIADRFPEVFLSVGCHPLHIDEAPPLEPLIQQLYQAAEDKRVVAIGETGLDFFKANNSEAQIVYFKAHIAVAQALDLPLIIHCRDAAAAARELLAQVGPVKAVMHCWTGTAEETRWFADLGFYISFSGVVTFKKATTVHEAVLVVPQDQLLIETDCPYLAPVPMRGKRNEPAFVTHTAQRVAALRGWDLADLARITTANARRLFRLPGDT